MEEEWDEFQKQLQDMNVDEYIKLYQDAYDRYYSEN